MNPISPHPQTTRRVNPWPLAIIATFAVFISSAAIFISWALGQNMDLVRRDYYDHEILFQRRIDEIKRTNLLRLQLAIAYDPAKQTVTVKLPKTHATVPLMGRVHVYRPSNARLDHDLPLRVSADGTQQIPTRGWQAGLWKVQVSWAVEGQSYYFEQPVLISE